MTDWQLLAIEINKLYYCWNNKTPDDSLASAVLMLAHLHLHEDIQSLKCILFYTHIHPNPAVCNSVPYFYIILCRPHTVATFAFLDEASFLPATSSALIRRFS